jgi:alpha-glucosidase
MLRLFTALVLICSPLVALAAPVQIASPGKVLSVQIDTDPDGRPSYRVLRNGKPVIASSRLGFILADAPKFERNLVLGTPTTRSFDETWEQPWGERRLIRNHYNELRVTLTEKIAPRRSFDVVFRVYDDGVGFRYAFPDQPQLKDIKITEELTEFNIADEATAWWNDAFGWNREEYLYHRTPIEQVGVSQTPITLRTEDGLHLSIHEAALMDYSGMNLVRTEGRRLRAALTPGSGTFAKVERSAPFNTPWRTLQVGHRAGDLVESSLILNLNAPNTLGDVSWFKPMKYVGVWWEMHLDKKTWASGPKHGATTQNVMRHIDFAAAHHLGGVLVEGWNIGWDGDWFGNGQDFDFSKPYPDYDLPRLAAYARSKGIHLIGHNETSGNAAHYESQMEQAFTLYEKLGIDAIKTGYVADAGQAKVIGRDGQVHYGWHEGQDMVNHAQRVVDAAARHHIAVDAHEPVKDTGLRRTYPNFVSREGSRGMEYNAWGNPGNPPEHEVNLVFTRLLAGPMDFTPGIFRMQTKPGSHVSTTLAKQLALYVTLYSPIQMAADLLDNYQANPAPFKFIEDVAVDWEDTRVLNGEVGDYVTIVRKQRGAEDWFLGSITNAQPRVLQARLDFLTPGKRYTAQIYRDADDADWAKNPEAVKIETRQVTSAETLTLKLAPGGGQAIRFVAQ